MPKSHESETMISSSAQDRLLLPGSSRSSSANQPREATASRKVSRSRGRSPRRYRRLRRLALALVVATWVPGMIGGALGISALRWWAIACGYLGVSWMLPALLLGVAADRAARERGLRRHRAQGVTTGIVVGILLLIGAGALIGS
jgi:hypothetical protein